MSPDGSTKPVAQRVRTALAARAGAGAVVVAVAVVTGAAVGIGGPGAEGVAAAAAASGDRMAKAAEAGPHRLALVAPSGSRLGDELRRELEYSALGGIEVLPPERAGAEWLKGAADLVTAGWPEVVTVRADERQLAVLSRATTAQGGTATFALNVESSDRASRRRACLTVVEYLRTLNAGIARGPNAGIARGPNAGIARGPNAGAAHVTPLARSDEAARSRSDAGQTTPEPSTKPGPGPEPSPRALEVVRAAATTAGPAPAPAPAARTATATTATTATPTTTTATTTATAGSATIAPRPATATTEHDEEQPGIPEPPLGSTPPPLVGTSKARATHATEARTWNMGVTTTIDFAPPRDHPTAHLNFLWHFPLGEGWWIRARADWPLLGVNLQPNGEDLRMWTFGASVGLGRTFGLVEARWRPYVALAVGNRMALTDVSSQIPLQGRTFVTPSATVEGEGGVRLRLRSRAELLAALALSRAWSVLSDNAPIEARTAGNAFALHVALGVLFEF